jgi:hypothetical protein
MKRQDHVLKAEWCLVRPVGHGRNSFAGAKIAAALAQRRRMVKAPRRSPWRENARPSQVSKTFCQVLLT